MGSQLRRVPRFVSLAAILTIVVAQLAACGGGGGGGGTSSPISVTATASATVAQVGSSVQLTANVSGDAQNLGVNWRVTCTATDCGSVSPTSTPNGASTTYTPPATAPVADLAVSVVASSVSDPTKGASVIITVPAVTITEIDVTSTTVPIGTSSQLRVLLAGDANNKGVNWTLSCGATDCGTIAPTSSLSGVYVTYSPPAVQPTTDLAINVTATSVASPGATASDTLTIPAIAVAIQVDNGLVPSGTTMPLTATVTYDSGNGGVTWSLSCTATDCGSIAPTSSASGAMVTYTAPALPPPGNLGINVTATAVDNPLSMGTLILTVPAIAVSITPASALLPLNIPQSFIAAVTGDTANQGVTWTLDQGGSACTSGCGTLTPLATASGAPASYTAPAALPASEPVDLTATAVDDPTKSSLAAVTVTSGTVSLVPADLTLSGNFATQTAALTNTGSSSLSISGVTITGTNAGDFAEADDCGTILPALASCTITIAYHTTARGTHTAILSIADSSSDSPQVLHLTGLNKANGSLTSATPVVAVAAPRPTGASAVGTRAFHWIDAKRVDPYVGNGVARELMIRLWYPAAGSGACTRALYTGAGVWAEYARLLKMPLPTLSTNSCQDAPVAAGAHPLVLVTHGFTGTSSDYTYLAEELASRSYVVAAVDHTYESTAVEFPDGRVVRSVYGSHLSAYARSDIEALRFAKSVRVADLRFVLDRLAGANATAGSALEGRIDLARIALVGHSLGGLATIESARKDPRIRAAVSLDGLVMDRLTPPVRTPVLMIRAGSGSWNENDCQLWSVLRGGRASVHLIGAGHTALSDEAWIAPAAVAAGVLGADGTIAITRSVSVAFLDAALAGRPIDAAALGALPRDAGIVVTLGASSQCPAP